MSMRVVGIETLKRFIATAEDGAARDAERWVADVSGMDWAGPADVLRTYPDAVQNGAEWTFPIKRSGIHIVTLIRFKAGTGIITVRGVQ